MADTVDHTHGDTGEQPPQDRNFQSGGFPQPEEFDWFWTQVPVAINDHATTIEAIDADEDGVVDEATVAQSADAVKGNDIDTDGDGKVDAADEADNATTVKGKDIDSNGDGKVDAAEEADNATTVKGNDIDSDGDGKVNAADEADQARSIPVRSSAPSNPQDGEIWILDN